MVKFEINQKKEYKKCVYFYLLIFLILLVIGCSKNANQKNVDAKTEITGSVIEDSKENCRFANESDCRPIEIKSGDAENEEANNTENANAENNTKKIINISEENFILKNCEEKWKCVEAKYRAYQFSNCSWTSIEYCVYGCGNGTCNPPPICKLNSLKCDKDNLLICGEEGYEWKLNESCDYRCENGVCIGKNETIQTNTTNSTNTTQGYNFITDNCMSVPEFNYAPAGNNLSNEYFTLKNSCSYSIDISGWTAKDDAATSIFTFASFNLNVNAEVSVHTGNGTNTSTNLYRGRGSAVWNNDEDTLYLNTANDTSVLICPYPNNGSISNCPDL